MGRLIVVNATWDAEGGVWVAESSDLPLVTEAATVEELAAKLPGIIQDLLEDDDGGDDVDVPFKLVTSSESTVRVRSRAA